MFGLKTRARMIFGHVASVMHPKLAREVRAGDIGGPKRQLKRWIAKAELARLDARGERAKVEHALTRRWTSENMPVDYYDIYAARFEAMFNGPHARIVDWLKDFAAGAGVSHVIEVGCGDGRALVAMATRVPEVPRWTGVDISAAIIKRNQECYTGQESLEFVSADAAEWLDAHLEPGTLLMTYGGVMEYIAPETLEAWFALVAERGGAGILLTEPVDPAHDLARDQTSHLWGFEGSYSHNHRALLEKAGHRIVTAAEVTWAGFRWVMLLARPDMPGHGASVSRPEPH